MRTQKQLQQRINTLNAIGVSFNRMSKDFGVSISLILKFSQKPIHQYQAELATLRKIDDGVNRYISTLIEGFEGELHDNR
ncbi:hypothetical protein PO181_00225 [Leuconostoc suionicum]|uniref:hypothetical protein n=1 Tax=Leuconostoc suionicum TaxID=1511761 RepID=UPI00233E6B70|nr:hypothetical protein [Leuconostoc suionicum]MDC2815430.1 hypothetical protein [Leuconostoc suionicum]